MDEIRQDVDDLKFGLELLQIHSKRLANANQAKNIDTAILESSELAHSMNQFITTLKSSHIKSFVDNINAKETDPNVQIKYQSILTNLQMMEDDFSKIHKFMLLKDSIMVLNKANKDAGDIIGNVEAAKKLLPETLDTLVYNGASILETGVEAYMATVDAQLGFPIAITENYITPMENYFKSLPQEELKKQVEGLKDTATEIKDWREDFKGRIPAYKSMAKDLHTFNKSVDKFANSVDVAAKSLHKQSLMAEDLTRSVSTHIKEAQQAFPTLHTDIMSGIDATNNLLGTANKIASYKIDIPAAAQKMGNMDGLKDTLRDFGVPPEKMQEYLEEEKRSAKQTSLFLDLAPGIGEVKQGIQLFTGEEMFTHDKYAPSDFVWGTLTAVTGGTTKVIGRTFGKLGDLEKNAQKLGNVTKNVSKGSFDVAAFDKKIAKMNINEKAAEIKIASKGIAEQNGWKKDSKLSRVNKRDVYVDSKSNNLYALDTQHGRFEVLNKKGKHQGEVDFNLNSTKPADKSGGHDLKLG
ncbi:colicin E3/pyocin S6 family cytotoxin [Bacillus toyonensis]|uniref:colicin E3/pyocin S6 family cytotoxin n=1 Tax=Bacillus toyonensis TaxID=155322 RepID=UPI001F0A05B4|nr:colicin E3/pyocin S6 family cytotoxin [Bacillus toyonensis]